MKLEDTTIYPLIREHPELCLLHPFHKNQYITHMNRNIGDIWYLVSGRVKVEATSPKGKRLLVDLVDEDNYVGNLSNYYGQNFYCDCIAMTNCSLLHIPMDTFQTLMRTINFSHHFYMKTNARLYNMYKRELMRAMFTQRQQFAFYLLEKNSGGICKIDSIYFIGEYLKVSRRNLYNLLTKFEQVGMVLRLESGDIQLLDAPALQEIAKPVVDFYYNRI